MNIYYCFQDLQNYSNKDLGIFKKYYNIPDHIHGDDLIWLIASNIHSNKMNMAPDKVWVKYNSSLIPLLHENLLENDTYKQLFLDSDPDPKKKNLEWMITSFISGGYNISELPQLKLAINKFNKLRKKNIFKNNLVDFGGLHGFNRNNKEFPSLIKFLNTYPDVVLSNNNFNIIEDNTNVKIIQPLNESTSCKYGANTKWCTSAREDNQFDEYNSTGDLYIIILKKPTRKGEKYKLYIRSNYTYEDSIPIMFMDEYDEEVDINNLINTYPYLKDITLLKYALLRLNGLKMSYKEYIESGGDNLIYNIRDGKHEFKDGNYWYQNGELHRIEFLSGEKQWYLDGNLHREDGPAIELIDGTKEWYLNGKKHRVDGPAIEQSDGTKKWYLNDKKHRIGGPAIERSDGTKKWYLNGKKHRIGGPALEMPNGDKYWYQNGKLHRIGGPAVELINGTKEWYLDGNKLPSQ
jgi:hypothetical protein